MTDDRQHEGTVLIVDDNLDLAASLAMLEGFGAATAPHGAAALEYLRDHPPPRLIILDLVMPVMDGRAFLACKRRNPDLAGIPVLVATARTGTIDLDEFPDVVCVAFKPVDPEKLIAALRSRGWAAGAG